MCSTADYTTLTVFHCGLYHADCFPLRTIIPLQSVFHTHAKVMICAWMIGILLYFDNTCNIIVPARLTDTRHIVAVVRMTSLSVHVVSCMLVPCFAAEKLELTLASTFLKLVLSRIWQFLEQNGSRITRNPEHYPPRSTVQYHQ